MSEASHEMVHLQQDATGEIAGRLTARMAADCLGVRVGRLHRLVVREFDRRLRPLGLSLQQLEVLSTLTACGGPVRPTVVADLLAVERSTMSRNLAVLDDRGWVRGSDVSTTGRSLTVVITPAGTATLAAAAVAWADAQSALTAALGPAAATLDGWLTALTAGQPPAPPRSLATPPA